MRVLLIGAGAREHALFWKISQSPELSYLRVYPGNGAIEPESIVQEPIDLGNLSTVRDYVQKDRIDLTIVGPELPLADGITDILAPFCAVFGPSQDAARLETSKLFAKNFMKKYCIPTAGSAPFTSYETACEYIKDRPLPIVIKADGLAAGKGVWIAQNYEEAKIALHSALNEQILGEAGRTVLIEDFLVGKELSVFALCDGEKAIPFLPVQDYKRVGEGDSGPNTGGMGAYLPVPFADESLREEIHQKILDPVIQGMRLEGTPFRGLLYAGLMIHETQAHVLEFNVRFGDPETQALLPMLKNDLLPLLYQAASGRLKSSSLEFHKGACVNIVLAAKGYPGSFSNDIFLKKLDITEGDIILWHAGTRREGDSLRSTGGRVWNLTAQGSDLQEARTKAYRFLAGFPAEGLFYRRDIAEGYL